MLTKVLGNIVSGAVGPVVTYFTRRAELKQARFEAELKAEQAKGERVAALLSQGLAADASWEMEQIKNAGWKDEVGYLLFVYAVMSCFIPALAPSTLEGFRILGTTPAWFQVAAVAVLLAPFGIRTWRRQQYDTP
jgi:hypothetical protein